MKHEKHRQYINTARPRGIERCHGKPPGPSSHLLTSVPLFHWIAATSRLEEAVRSVWIVCLNNMWSPFKYFPAQWLPGALSVKEDTLCGLSVLDCGILATQNCSLYENASCLNLDTCFSLKRNPSSTHPQEWNVLQKRIFFCLLWFCS